MSVVDGGCGVAGGGGGASTGGAVCGGGCDGGGAVCGRVLCGGAIGTRGVVSVANLSVAASVAAVAMLSAAAGAVLRRCIGGASGYHVYSLSAVVAWNCAASCQYTFVFCVLFYSASHGMCSATVLHTYICVSHSQFRLYVQGSAARRKCSYGNGFLEKC